jgi:hypothetical protein
VVSGEFFYQLPFALYLSESQIFADQADYTDYKYKQKGAPVWQLLFV